jgi:hypothetical protein
MAFEELYYNGPVGDLYIRPILCKVVATFSNTGATVTVSTTRRQSHPGTLITGDTGAYSVTGLPVGTDYHIVGIHMMLVTAANAIGTANVTAFDASAGTLAFSTKTAGAAETDPEDGAKVYITLEIETGAPQS